jgi:hypothetical protein
MAPRWEVWLGTLALCALGVGAVQPARASEVQARRPVVLDGFACDLVGERELRELFALELAPRPLWTQSDAPTASAPIRAQVRCSAAQAHLRVEDTGLERSQELDLDLEETIPEARARLLALTLSELVATLDMESLSRRSAPAEAQAQAPPPRAFAAHSGRFWLGAGVTREGRPRVFGPSLQSGLLWRLGSLPIAAQAEADASWGRRALSLGDIQTWNVAVSPSIALPVRLPRLELVFAVGVGLGYARIAGEVHDPASQLRAHVVAGPWWGPFLSAAALLPIQPRWALRAGLALSYVATPVRGLDPVGEVTYALAGLPLVASLGACLSL